MSKLIPEESPLDDDHHRNWVRALLFGAGVLSVFVFRSIRDYITQYVAADPVGWIDLLFLSMFIGVSSGHYLGKSLKNGQKLRMYYLFGIYATIGAGMTLRTWGKTPLGLVVPGLFAVVFILHLTGLTNEDGIGNWLDLLGNYGTGGVLTFIVGYNYLLPFLCIFIPQICTMLPFLS